MLSQCIFLQFRMNYESRQSEFSGKPTTSVDELCKIIWTVEADLEDGHLLYVTGDPAELGCWTPNMAALMSPTEHANIWKAEFQVT